MISNLLLIFFFVLIHILPVSAQQSGEVLVWAELISESKEIAPNDSFYIAVKLEIKDEWHTYWENPGDGGLKTTFAWTLPAGFSISEPMNSYPKRFKVDDMINFGYDVETSYLFLVKTSNFNDFEKSFYIKTELTWLACKEECIPGTSLAEITLFPTNDPAEIIKENPEYFKMVERTIPTTGLKTEVTAELNNEQIIFIIKDPGKSKKQTQIEFFPVEQGIFSYSTEQKLEINENNYSLTVSLDPMRGEIPDKINAVFYSPEGWDENGDYKAIHRKIKIKK